MSKFPDRDDPVKRFQQTECVDCGKRKKLDGRTKFDYWTTWAYEEGHVGESEYLWIRHDKDWRCVECAKEFYPINTDDS